MRVYCGDTRSRRLLEVFRARGIGAVAQRGKLHYRKLSPWFFDNGAFEDWRAGRPFDAHAFRADLAGIDPADPPDFVVAPDRVAEGEASLLESLEWLPELRARPWPVYLAVQDGMEGLDLGLPRFDGIFIGGTLPWKLRTAPHWCAVGRGLGLPVHFARCGHLQARCVRPSARLRLARQQPAALVSREPRGISARPGSAAAAQRIPVVWRLCAAY